jgi:3-deoxy-manno-octulosonate cytidylyltransferase (CMP-KDO synthetase)
MLKNNDIIAVVPARLGSLRLPNKLLLKIDGTTILEHVINRLILSDVFSKIIIASPNIEIKKIIKKYKNVSFFKSKKKHFSGTSRSIEAVKNMNFSKLIVVFGDEPLIRPDEIKYFTNKICQDRQSNIWNATIDIKNKYEFKDKSIVKCFLDKNNNIFNLKRHFKFDFKIKEIIRKSVGLIAFRSDIIKRISNLKKTNIEKIEQLNFLNNKKILLKSIKLKHNFFSINTINDYKKIKIVFKSNRIQKKISTIYKIKN